MAGYIGTRSAVVSPGAERKRKFSITTTTTVFNNLTYTPGFVHLYLNGIRLADNTDYTATDGSTITLTSPAENGDEVIIVSYATFSVADAYTKPEVYNKSESDAIYATIASPNLTGIPTAPTAASSTNTTQIATTAFVQDAVVTGLTSTSVSTAYGGAAHLSVGQHTTFFWQTAANNPGQTPPYSVGTSYAGSTFSLTGTWLVVGATRSYATYFGNEYGWWNFIIKRTA